MIMQFHLITSTFDGVKKLEEVQHLQVYFFKKIIGVSLYSSGRLCRNFSNKLREISFQE